MSYQDNFTQVQQTFSGSLNNNGSWGPGGSSATRTLSANGGQGNPSITQGDPHHPGFVAASAPNSVNSVTYNYPSNQNFSGLESITFHNCHITTNSQVNQPTYAQVYIGGQLVGSSSITLPTNGSSVNFTVPITVPAQYAQASSSELKIWNYSPVSLENGYILGYFTSVFS